VTWQDYALISSVTEPGSAPYLGYSIFAARELPYLLAAELRRQTIRAIVRLTGKTTLDNQFLTYRVLEGDFHQNL
jgi:hypothetical protein